jgi:hypothetical protein
MVEKIVYDSTKDGSRKPKKKDPKEKGGADEALHKNDIGEPLTEFPCKMNKWGFIGVRKAARPNLPFQPEEPLKAKIEGNALIITKA